MPSLASRPALPPSRRERPAKPALTRAGIVAAALRILRRDGLPKVTMRRIAAELDTGAASLYVYLRDTEDLHAHLLDALLGSVATTRGRGSWRDRLKGMLGRYMEVLLAHPEMARMAMSTMPSGPNYLALANAILGLLHEGGVSDGNASWAVDLLLLYATAQAAEHGAWRNSPHIADEFAALGKAIAAADARRYPHLARLRGDLLSGGGERMSWGLEVILAGVLVTPRPRSRKGAS